MKISKHTLSSYKHRLFSSRSSSQCVIVLPVIAYVPTTFCRLDLGPKLNTDAQYYTENTSSNSLHHDNFKALFSTISSENCGWLPQSALSFFLRILQTLCCSVKPRKCIPDFKTSCSLHDVFRHCWSQTTSMSHSFYSALLFVIGFKTCNMHSLIIRRAFRSCIYI